METVRQQIDDILSGAAASQDWALHFLGERDLSTASIDEIVNAHTALIRGLVDAVRELADQVDARSR
jgi:hypothetical protein